MNSRYTVKITVQNGVKDEQGNYYYSPVAYLDVPFTISEPTAAELQKQYTYNSFYYNATDGIFTVVDIDNVAVSDLIKNSSLNTSELEAVKDDNYNGEVSINNGIITWNSIDNDGKEVAKGKVYSFSGATFQYLNGTFEIPTFKVKFVNSKPYTLNMASANVTVQSGNPASTETILYAEKATKDEPIFYNVKDVFSQFVKAENINTIQIVNFVSPKGQTGQDLLTQPVVNPDDKSITITATSEKASQNSTATVKVKATMNDGKTVEGTFTVTIKAYPVN